jgi:hypothetical protein
VGRRRPWPRLLALQQENALQQHQLAVQNAVQLTSSLLQSANGAAPSVGVVNGTLQQFGTPAPISLQQQQNALQIAMQQTTAVG